MRYVLPSADSAAALQEAFDIRYSHGLDPSCLIGSIQDRGSTAMDKETFSQALTKDKLCHRRWRLYRAGTWSSSRGLHVRGAAYGR
jgi:hypothetical protein